MIFGEKNISLSRKLYATTNIQIKMSFSSDISVSQSTNRSIVENDDTQTLIKDSPTSSVDDSCQCIQARHVLAFLAFLGFFNVYCLRINLSVALVAMVNSSSADTNSSSTSECKASDSATNTTAASNSGEFNWDEQTQGLILSAFFYGYIITQVPGGYLAERFGAKLLFGFGILCTSTLTLVTPIVARWNLFALYALRFIEGLGEGVTYPAMHAMWGNWAPVWERTKLAGIAYSGAQLGTVFSMPISGFLCYSDFLGGWPSVFYVFGCLSIVWVIAWFCLVHDTPASHPRISKSEREYIENSIGKREVLATPWMKILTCGALWGIAVASVANGFGAYVYLTSLPTFMERVLKFDIKSDGLLSALPFTAMWIVMTFGSFLADYLRTNNYLTTLNTRRLMTSLGLLLPAAFLVGVSYVGCDHIWAVTLLTLALGTNGFIMAGSNINHLDIAPKFAGVMLGITNGLGNIPGFLAPTIIGYLTANNETIAGWRVVFLLASGIYVIGAIVYMFLARGDELVWARERPKSDSTLSQASTLSQGNTVIQHRELAPPYNTETDIPPPVYTES